MTKLLVIELDGATWEIINPLLAAGKMPHLSGLIKSGAHGVLRSDPPLLSPRLWVSIFSGKNSTEHGIDFFGSSTSMVKCKRIWDICNDNGMRVGIFGTLVTWPPYPVNGFMIPSLFSIGTETYPDDYRFLQELTLGERRKGKSEKNRSGSESMAGKAVYYASKLWKCGVRLATFSAAGWFLLKKSILRQSPDDTYWRKTFLHQRICTDIFAFLYRKYAPDFSTHHIHFCDALSHRYWKYFEPQKFRNVPPALVSRYGKVIPGAYEEADRNIGRFIQLADEQTIIMVLSDHGCQALDMERESYKVQIEFLLDCMSLQEKVVPASVGFMVFLYFPDRSMLPETAAVLKNASFPDTGEILFDLIMEESLIGIRLKESFWGQDIPEERQVRIGSMEVPFHRIFSPHKADVSGDHKIEGIFVVAGPGIQAGKKITGADIYDVTPTSLAILGLPVAEDMGGRILSDIFIDPPATATIPSYEPLAGVGSEIDEELDIDAVKKRLRSLGYL